MTMLLNQGIKTNSGGIDLKGGLTWEAISNRIAVDDKYKKDVESSAVFFDWDNNLRIEGKPFKLTSHALTQVLSRFTPSGVRYMKRMIKDGDIKGQKLVQDCVNYGIQKYTARVRGGQKPLLIRTRQLPDGTNVVRSVLSDRYQVLDNHEILQGIVQRISGSMIPARLLLNDTGFELMVIDRLLSREIADGDRNYVANFYRNSETGNGSFAYIMGIFRAICLNGMSMPVETHGFRTSHVSKADMNKAIEDGIYQSFSQAPQVFAKLEQSRELIVPRPLVNPTIQMISVDGKWTANFESQVQQQATREENSKYGIIQAITHSAKSLSHEKFKESEAFAGRLLASDFNRYVRGASKALPVG